MLLSLCSNFSRIVRFRLLSDSCERKEEVKDKNLHWTFVYLYVVYTHFAYVQRKSFVFACLDKN